VGAPLVVPGHLASKPPRQAPACRSSDPGYGASLSAEGPSQVTPPLAHSQRKISSSKLATTARSLRRLRERTPLATARDLSNMALRYPPFQEITTIAPRLVATLGTRKLCVSVAPKIGQLRATTTSEKQISMATHQMDLDTGVASRRTDRHAERSPFTETKAGSRQPSFCGRSPRRYTDEAESSTMNPTSQKHSSGGGRGQGPSAVGISGRLAPHPPAVVQTRSLNESEPRSNSAPVPTHHRRSLPSRGVPSTCTLGCAGRVLRTSPPPLPST
jgi:hypothetical protein